jgi:hypothetical protein
MGEKNPVLSDPFEGTFHPATTPFKLCDLSPRNTNCLMSLFPYTKPVSLRRHPVTLGMGSHLRPAIPGLIRALEKFDVRPILARLSVTKNMRTGLRSREEIQDAAWAVFQENYQKGYGAEGIHAVSLEEVRSAIDAGASMISLNLSGKLLPEVMNAPMDWVNRRFQEEIDPGDAEVLLHLLAGREFRFMGPRGELAILLDQEKTMRNILLFHRGLDFAEEVYDFIRPYTGYRDIIDFGISIDETPFPTFAENHLFLVIALSHRGVRIDSLAPRLTKEVREEGGQLGDFDDFQRQLYHHLLIARDYGGYRISIRSGENRFSFFPMVVELGGGLHLETEEASWLEALRLISWKDPNFHKQIQSALNSKAIDLFRERIERTLTEYEEDYWSLLEQHIENHLLSGGLPKKLENIFE